jgi:2-octaprenyl-6-methoxyphenol hydroxylase
MCAVGEDEFIDGLQAAFGQRLGALKLAGPRGSYPLARVLCDRAAVDRAVLIGNAGHALHPAAAQGFNLAIRDALLLAAMLRERLAADSAFDPGDADLLSGWAEARRPDQHRVANFTDTIVRLFSNRIPMLDHARGAGLFGLSLLPSIRDDMARRSMGLALAPARIREASS